MEFLAMLYTVLLVAICLMMALLLFRSGRPTGGLDEADCEELKDWLEEQLAAQAREFNARQDAIAQQNYAAIRSVSETLQTAVQSMSATLGQGQDSQQRILERRLQSLEQANNQQMEQLRRAMVDLKKEMDDLSAETPYGIPYRPHIWGAGWDIQRLRFQHYFLHQAFPDIFGADMILDALNFVLGCHPGSNTASFASGVGTRSATTAYGINRADWSYTPGGVVSGTALIRPDFPELLEFPFLWQQTEYVLGGGSSHYMFLVLAAQQLLKK